MITEHDTLEILRTIVNHSDFAGFPFFELRYHGRYRLDIVQEGMDKVELSNGVLEGVSVRIIYDGSIGSAATNDLTIKGLKAAINIALKAAKATKGKDEKAAETPPSRGVFKSPVKVPIKSVSLEDKKIDIKELQSLIMEGVPNLKSSNINYFEIK
ncbi:MAG: PmbA/TldA family metallopeptidase [Candidatus Hodarchaeales archaeon]